MSARYTIRIAPAAKKQLKKFSDRKTLTRIANAIDGLQENPRPNGSEKLSGTKNLWRIRIGTWRVIYAIEGNEIIIILTVRHRKEVYEDIGNLVRRLQNVDPEILRAEIK
ncbi:MAG: type II toxin-antitoxin system RelE/ParE family toxin, partial [Rhodospirillales bacterium]|nr:type II toxin-antitoxin system RelE/ParE family toxin [Rhodospirillales bacterium]